MILGVSKEKCTGCGVCATICPVQCITLIPDEEGFKYPQIDKSKCIQCGKCSFKCHAIHVIRKDCEIPKSYLAYNKNEEERRNSSSGGAFIAFARRILLKNGVVYGAAIDDELQVRHIRVTQLEDLHKLQGSKYVQSYIDNEIYESVSNDLKKGLYVLYSGTPCQIGAMRHYLPSNKEKLLTVSFICHGVPSPLVWKKYVTWQAERNNSKISNVSFRNKDYGWTEFSMKLNFENGKIYCKKLTDDPFLQVFLKNICLRPSCHSCQYKGKAALSCIDIILADRWGNISEEFQNKDDNKGISIVLLQNDMACELWNEVSGQFHFIDANYQQIIKSNVAYEVSAKKSPYRKKFFNSLNDISFDLLYKKYARTPISKKCKRLIYQSSYLIAKKLGVVNIFKQLIKK